ncbi:hypothetical protein ACN2XU_04735 [Primorskyibacter sp. 2E107]|uniref:hypothetical protein n=1 Tax=Primorskyibacter sp. 2E107 TaxID=3403458 RepID=UPI003AF587A9
MPETPVHIGPSGFFAIKRIDKPMQQFQVLGERASGTNLLRKTIEKNLDIQRTEGLGWKHGFPQMVAIPERLLVLCIVRNAADWARSMYKRPWHGHPELQKRAFPDFIRHQWVTIVDRPADFEMIHPELAVKGAALQLDRDPISGLAYDNLFALRTAKLRALAGMANRGRNIVFIRMEDFTADPERMLKKLSEEFDISPKRPFYKPVLRRLGTRFNPAVNDRPDPPNPMRDADRAHMLAHLDADIEASFGYTYT